MHSCFSWLWRNPPSSGSHHQSRSGGLRRLCLAMAAMFTWTFIVSTPVYAMAHQPPPKPIPGVRRLNSVEMAKIMGKGILQIALGGSGTQAGTDGGQDLSVSRWVIYAPPGAGSGDTQTGNGTTGPNGWKVSWVNGTGTVFPGTVYSYVFGYNTNHDLTDIETPRGFHWTFNYNSDDSLAWAKDPYLNQTSVSYSGTVNTVTDANSNHYVYTYDSSGRITQEKDPLLDHQDYSSYTANNQPQTITDRRGFNWKYTYDSNGNMLTAEDPYLNSSTWTYSSHNRVLTAKLPSSRQTVLTYDTHDNLTQVDHKDTSGVIQATEKYTVNSNGLITDFYDSNNHHYQYGHSTNGDLTSQTTPNSHQTQWTYDALGVIATRTDALTWQTTYTPDAWERIVTITYPDTSTKTYQFDADNNLTQFTDVSGTTTRNYDNADRLLSESKGGSTVVSYGYDATGKKGLLSTVTDANSRVITYSYTTRDELYQVSETAGTATYSYDANGNQTGITNQNGTMVTNVFDNANQLTGVTNKNSSGTVLSSFSYVLDVDGRWQTCTEANGDVTTYGYDWAGRLTSESRTGTNAYSESYVLDSVGNRTSQTIGGVTTTLTLDNDDQLTATSGGFTNSYGYNANGEQTSRTLSGTAYTLSYDYDGELTSIVQGSNTTSFTYDALGRRVSRTAGGTTTNFLYDGDSVLLEKQGSSFTATYTYGNDLMRKDGEYPLFDGLDNERTVTNSSQTVTGTLTQDGFGKTIATTGSSTNPYMYKALFGYRTDGDAGLVQDGSRYYDSQVGRFITRDSDISEAPYLYCDGDPVNYVDTDGHKGKPKGGGHHGPGKGRGRGKGGGHGHLGGNGNGTNVPANRHQHKGQEEDLTLILQGAIRELS